MTWSTNFNSWSEIFILHMDSFYICILYHVGYTPTKFQNYRGSFAYATQNIYSRITFDSGTQLEENYIPTKCVHVYTLYENFIKIQSKLTL